MDVAHLGKGDGIDDVAPDEHAFPVLHHWIFLSCGRPSISGKGREDRRDHHHQDTLQALFCRPFDGKMRDGQPAHEPACEEAHPPRRQKADLRHDQPFRLALRQIEKLLEFELHEVLWPEVEGDLVMNDPVNPCDHCPAQAENKDPAELAQGEARVDQIHATLMDQRDPPKTQKRKTQFQASVHEEAHQQNDRRVDSHKADERQVFQGQRARPILAWANGPGNQAQ